MRVFFLMQALVTVITGIVLQKQSGLGASLPACSVTGPGFVQAIYLNFTMKIQWPLTGSHAFS